MDGIDGVVGAPSPGRNSTLKQRAIDACSSFVWTVDLNKDKFLVTMKLLRGKWEIGIGLEMDSLVGFGGKDP